MRILICPDKYKGTLTAREAAQTMAAVLRERHPNWDILERPLADGGEGSLDVLIANSDFIRERDWASNAAGQEVEYEYGRNGSEAALEVAAIIGLHTPALPPLKERTTYGIGQWILVMKARGCRELHLFLGGSATCDGGFGLARALGLQASGAGEPILHFRDILRADRVAFPPAVPGSVTEMKLWTDVSAPLLGDKGAAALFAPQKGATPAEVKWLESALMHFQKLLHSMRPDACTNFPGSGAAGGLALGLSHWPGGRCSIKSGSDFFLELSGVRKLIASRTVDMVIVGEGCTDAGTLQGKLVHRVQKWASSACLPCWILSGSYRDLEQLRAAGYNPFLPRKFKPQPRNREEAQQQLSELTGEWLEEAGFIF
ncbi:MAG: glycerate kinase [Spirochaetales bacterium]|nr:glycerate kinase [Spirochaetales bacterium]